MPTLKKRQRIGSLPAFHPPSGNMASDHFPSGISSGTTTGSSTASKSLTVPKKGGLSPRRKATRIPAGILSIPASFMITGMSMAIETKPASTPSRKYA